MGNKSEFNTQTMLITGGYGFIGSNFIRYIFEKTDFKGKIINVDKLTYAANPMNLSDIEEKFRDRYFFEHVDICNFEDVYNVFEKYDVDSVVHFAAESHVDRSIHGPKEFIDTNITGTFNLLEAAKKHWLNNSTNPPLNESSTQPLNQSSTQPITKFHHVSTDEVYGTLGDTGYFYETTPYDPRSPYSASKASSDHLVRSYYHTYGLPITISNCTNNYGPLQFPEKLIPLMILNITEGKQLPVYGDGQNIRDWIYVDDHNDAVWKILEKGKTGETYNIGGENEWTNLELVEKLCELLDELYPVKNNSNLKAHNSSLKSYKELITFVKDRPGHDRRYAINCDKIKNELGWQQKMSFEEGLRKTVKWYLDNREWVETIRSGEYKKWLEKNYSNR
ncbi:MAG: dTDP-glucose 4,6-dehydratase [Flexistipes sinusarabici]|uniref:dTDP-glucose 4,6-dehydratase n=1 Tax=Flexistipes sinusarabici TaxID=2352 RepID=A0A5D0MHN2_FLESI|nr:dTDP-glucose 4,6-dehydratase [Flexistipes sinusarabici]TYB33224.1 MAG: dTDP-glucose 4,6-dehydratase [Flexistipes sinusarabici]